MSSLASSYRQPATWLILGTLTAACTAPSTGSTPPEPLWKARPGRRPPTVAQPQPARLPHNPWTECYAGFRATGNPRGDLARLVRTCGPLGGMRPLTAVRVARQAAAEAADRYTFYVTQPPRCYRVFAAADSRITDLDLLLRDPSGEQLSADLTHDAWPILPPHGPLCFDQPGLYMLEVSVFLGEGNYAVQVWGT